ncbi:MAG: SPFH domain-containing protein [Desulfobacterales bacterium]|nr:SPFH domain-containing protein [Desulfobacterales bacterium]MDJ0802027.1 SPFH domain-containing protein [Desulfobacterales bacterium]MDJ0874599.1 SPFH domain-containing protein [Desulfobacterales bacterium]MDJ0885587.1 SPFH domain-containing protein [Desulfobacterales bacterium]
MADQISQKIIRRAYVKTVVRRVFAFAVLCGIIYGLAALVYATKTIYKVKENYAVVLERLGGRREAVTAVGWHPRLPFFTRIEQEVPLMNQDLNLGGSTEPMRIISGENVALWTSAQMTYRIRDLQRWAIENLQPQKLLLGDYDGIVKDILQAQPVNNLISDREKIKEEIFQALKLRPINIGGPTLEEKYGIEVVSFVLKETRFGDKLVAATEEKKRRELIAEAENYAADQEASRIRKLYAAYLEGVEALQQGLGRPDGSTDTAILQFLVQQQWASAYENNQEGQNTLVIQNTTGQTSLALPAPAPALPSKGE